MTILIFLQIILFLFITPGLPRVVIVSHTLKLWFKNDLYGQRLEMFQQILFKEFLVVFIIGSFLSDNPQVLNYLKWAGILYIVYLAYDTYTAKIRSINSKEQSSKSIFSFYKDGFMVAGLSPKAIIFFGTIFSSFINYESNIISQFLILMTLM